MANTRSIWIGYDPREAAAFAVARYSARRFMTQPIPARGIVLDDLREKGLYTREMTTRNIFNEAAEKWSKVLWDKISDAPCATEFSISRFLTPHLAGRGWALFMDCDMLVRANLTRLFEEAERQPDKALLCVQHAHAPVQTTKMDGQIQTVYPRKNWSSFMMFNCDHPANQALTVEAVNSLPGRDLHRFCWLEDGLIGDLDGCWNFLVGHSDPEIEPNVVHFTDGIPLMEGYENVPYADEWRAMLRSWAS